MAKKQLCHGRGWAGRPAPGTNEGRVWDSDGSAGPPRRGREQVTREDPEALTEPEKASFPRHRHQQANQPGTQETLLKTSALP